MEKYFKRHLTELNFEWAILFALFFIAGIILLAKGCFDKEITILVPGIFSLTLAAIAGIFTVHTEHLKDYHLKEYTNKRLAAN